MNEHKIGYTVEQDEDGVWCAQAKFANGVAHGDSRVSESLAIVDLQKAAALFVKEMGTEGIRPVTDDDQFIVVAV